MCIRDRPNTPEPDAVTATSLLGEGSIELGVVIVTILPHLCFLKIGATCLTKFNTPLML